ALGRRSFLRRASVAGGAALAAGALGSAAAGVLPRGEGGGSEGASRPLDRKTTTGRTVAATTPAPGNESGTDADAGDDGGGFGFDFGAMPARVGDIEDHYVVDKNATDPTVDTDSWTLDVGGDVEEPYSLAHEDLLDHDAAVDEVVTTSCISNPVGGYLVSTVEWTGVPLTALLEEAGVRADAYDIVTHAADGYTESIPVEVADRDDILVAFGASGETLPVAHGFPARLLVPGRYGMKSTKWLTRIEASTRDHRGFWEQRGWSEEAVVNTFSYVRAAEVGSERTAVGGVAYAGTRGIRRVEVSVDGGETWQEAELEDPPGEHAWRRWRYVFDTPTGDSFETVVRAVDGTGARQTSERTSPHPDGSTGWHHRMVFL
ncbi:MAG: molybdopterin-dependent oxidoreductase, partial [Halobacteriaceae archaeon]